MRQIITSLSGLFETVAPAMTFTIADEARKENML